MTNQKKGLSALLSLVALGLMSTSYVHAQSGTSGGFSAPQVSAPQFSAPQLDGAQFSTPQFNAPQYGTYAPVASDCGCGTPAAASSSCGCSSCGGGVGGGREGGLLGCNESSTRDPWTLFGRRDQGLFRNVDIGGWFSAGFTEESTGLFNTTPDSFSLGQAWLFAEKAADGSNGLDFGWRFDGVYGVDAPDTQSFGNPGPTFDLNPSFTRGGQFGWAIPQAYGELASGKWNVKVGHFYTLVGYEVVTAPDNFFFSHSITSFNTEPFTHTGAIATYEVSDNFTLYGGWTAGWDSGFDFGAGSNFLGGFSSQLNDRTSLTYITTFGDFGLRSAGNDDAYSHSIVFDTALTDRLQWVVQSDLLRIDSTGEDNVGLNQYLIYSINDCTSIGTRVEWWKADEVTGFAPHGGVFPAGGGSHSYYEATFGVNRRLASNLLIRPEYRVDWSPALGYSEGFFAMDAILTY